MRRIADFIAQSLRANTIDSGSGVTGMGLFGSPKKRSRDAAAVITGAGSGIGAAFAVELARTGGRVVCSDIDENAARALPTRSTPRAAKRSALRCDVSQIDDVHCLAADAQDWFGGPPTVVINNAGVGAGGLPIGEVSLDDWHWVLGINLWGPIHGCHVFAPILREAGYGGIINVASAAAFGAAPGMAAYNVSKAGVLSLSETLAAELSGTGVNVTVLVPDIRQDQYRRGRPHLGQVHAARRPADALDRLLPGAGGPHVPGHPRPRRPLLHAPTRRPDRLGHQAFHPHGLHPRRRPHHPRHHSLGGSNGHRYGRDAGEDQGPAVGAGRHRLGRTGCRDDQRRTTTQAQGLHGRPVLDREHRRPRVRGAGQEGADADDRRDLPLLPRRGATARQCRTRADEALGHARRRRSPRTECQHPAGHRLARPLGGRHASVTARHRHSRCSKSHSTAHF